MSFGLLLVLHFLGTTLMTGVIWIVQLVHYPLMRYASADTFIEFETKHMNSISFVVLPSMMLEAVSLAAIFALFPKEAFADWKILLSAAALAGIWLSTFLLQVPLHNALLQGYSAETIQKLVSSNWIRTILWSLRCGLITFCLLGLLQRLGASS